MRKLAVVSLLLVLACGCALAQSGAADKNYQISGYVMGRYTDYLDTGDDQFWMPLTRLKLAVTLDPADTLVIQAEDTYKDDENTVKWTDAYLQHKWEGGWRLRMGMATVPYGFENCSSTPLRLGLDGPTVISRVLPGKRDLGLFLLYTPAKYSKLFKEMEKQDYGCGDWGLFSIAYYGGQGRDDTFQAGTGHLSARVAYPVRFGRNQIGEIGTSYFTGDYRTKTSSGAPLLVDDEMWGAHLFIAPRPFGLQAEYLSGDMPGLGLGSSPESRASAGGETVAADADGWYVQGSYRLGDGSILFARRDEYDGFRKSPTSQPKAEEYERTVYGYRRALGPSTEVTVEYDDIVRNGAEEDAWAVQVLQFF